MPNFRNCLRHAKVCQKLIDFYPNYLINYSLFEELFAEYFQLGSNTCI